MYIKIYCAFFFLLGGTLWYLLSTRTILGNILYYSDEKKKMKVAMILTFQ